MFAKLSKLGFGGRTLSLIKSMYSNDSLKFLINGKYSETLYLSKGVKQGMNMVIFMYPNLIDLYFRLQSKSSLFLFFLE